MSSLKPCKFTPKGSTKELSYDEMRQHLMDNYELVEAKPKAKKNEKAIEQEGRNIPERERPTEYEPGQAVSKPEAKPTSEGGKGQEGGVSKPEEGKRKEEVKSPADVLAEKLAADINSLMAAVPEVKGAISRTDKLINDLQSFKDGLKGNMNGFVLPGMQQAATACIDAVILALKANKALDKAFKEGMQALRDHRQYQSMTKDEQRDADIRMSTNLFNLIIDKVNGETRNGRFSTRSKESLADMGVPPSLIAKIDNTYKSRTQVDVDANVKALIDIVGMDGAVEIARMNGIHQDSAVMVFAYAYNSAKNNYIANPTEANKVELIKAEVELDSRSINLGQGQAMFDYMYDVFPELRIEQFKRDQKQKLDEQMGSEDNPESPVYKAKKVAAQVKKVRKDIFSALAGIASGEIDASEFMNPGGQYYISNNKIRDGLKVLLNYGQKLSADKGAKEAFGQLMEGVKAEGLLSISNNKSAVREQIVNNLNDINGKLKPPFSPKQLQDVADAFVDLYEEAGKAKAKQLLETAFAEKNTVFKAAGNSRVAKELLYGALDTDAVRIKFAAKYNIPYPSDAQMAEMNKLAAQEAGAKGSAKAVAKARLQTYMARLAGANSLNPLVRYKSKFDAISAAMVDSMLSGISTLRNVAVPNILRTGMDVAGEVFKGRSKRLAESMGSLRFVGDIQMKDGTIRNMNMLRPFDDMAASMMNNPKMGVSETETRTREVNSAKSRFARRFFLQGSAKAIGVIDASTASIATAITKRQAMEWMVAEAHKNAGSIPTLLDMGYSKADIDAMSVSQREAIAATSQNMTLPQMIEVQREVDAILGVTNAEMTAIANEAADDVMNSPLRKQLIDRGAIKATDPLPSVSALKNPLSPEAELYTEFTKRVYELMDDNVLNKIMELQESRGFDNLSADAKEVDTYTARHTNEINYYGRPAGTAGLIYDTIISLGKNKMGLKLTGYYPLFIGAGCNSIAYMAKITPGINLLQYAKYKFTGSRGAWTGGKTDNPEFQKAYITKADQAKMARNVLYNGIAFTAAIAYYMNKYNDDDEEKKALEKGKWSGIAIGLNRQQLDVFKDAEGNALVDGMIYRNGFPVYNAKTSPFYGFFAAVAYVKNERLFELDVDMSNKGEEKVLFKLAEDNPSFLAAVGNYTGHMMYTYTDASGFREFTSTAKDLLGYTGEESEISERVVNVAETKLSNALKTLIVPKSKLQSEMVNLYESLNKGSDKKKAIGFGEKVMVNTLFFHNLVKNNFTDPLGRPVDVKFLQAGLLLGFNSFELSNGEIATPFSTQYKSDPLMGLFIRNNYMPSVPSTIKAPVVYEVGGNVVDKAALTGLVLKAKEEGRDVKAEKLMKESEQVEKASEIYSLTRVQVNNVNQQTGSFVNSFLNAPVAGGQSYNTTNIEKTYTEAGFRTIMNKAYSIARDISVHQLMNKEITDPFNSGLRKAQIKAKISNFRQELSPSGIVLPQSWDDAILN